MSAAERRIAAFAVFALLATPVRLSDAPMRVPRCKPLPVLAGWIKHEDCLARGGHDCTRGSASP